MAETRAQQLRLREREAARRTALGPEAISAELRENAQINAAIARGELHEAQAQLQVAKINPTAAKCVRRAAGTSPTCVWPRATTLTPGNR